MESSEDELIVCGKIPISIAGFYEVMGNLMIFSKIFYASDLQKKMFKLPIKKNLGIEFCDFAYKWKVQRMN